MLRVIWGRLRGESAADVAMLPNCAHGTALCRTDGLRVRARPDTTGAILGALQAGDRLDVWDVSGDWYLIQRQTDGLTGWCFGDYVELIGALQP